MLERPAQAELQSAIRKLEQLGDYQTYFSNSSTAVVDAKVPHYQEYNYLHNLVTSAQLLVDHYADSAWLESHRVTNQTFQDALEEMQHAYRGCSLIFGVNRTTSDTKTEAPTASNTSNSNSNQSTTTPVAQITTTTSAQKSTNTTKSNTSSVKAETFTPVTATSPAQTADKNISTASNQDNTQTTSDDTASEIAVPATGNVEVSPRQVSWPALIAVVIAGAVVASIAIAVIIRHEPRRTTARSRRRY